MTLHSAYPFPQKSEENNQNAFVFYFGGITYHVANILSLNHIYNKLAENVNKSQDGEYSDPISKFLISGKFDIEDYCYYPYLNQLWLSIVMQGVSFEINIPVYHLLQSCHLVDEFNDETVIFTIVGEQYTESIAYFIENHTGPTEYFKAVWSWTNEQLNSINNLIPKFVK